MTVPTGALRALRVLGLAGTIAAPAGAQTAESRTLSPCDAPDVDAWVTHLRDRTLEFDLLARYAIRLFGSPVECEGEVTTVFDGNDFGFLRLGFAGGARLEIETRPPEASMATLRNPTGFADEETARLALEAYSDDIGVDIDWTASETTVDGDERRVTYSDPEVGLNAMASLIYRGETLVGLRFSLAL